MEFQITDSQKKFAKTLVKQVPAIASVIIGTWFLLTNFGRVGLGPAILIAGGVAVYGIWRQTRRQVDEDESVHALLNASRVNPLDLPLEFQFISNETTIQQVIAKAGPYSRTSETQNGFRYEWTLPYNAALLIFPEPSFSLESKVRAVYFRKPREDDDSMAL